MSLDIAALQARAALMRSSSKDGEHRIMTSDSVVLNGRTTSVLELGYSVANNGKWPVRPDDLVPLCGVEKCILHLGYKDPDHAAVQFAANRVVRRSLGDLFRAGRSRGLFKGIRSYAQ